MSGLLSDILKGMAKGGITASYPQFSPFLYLIDEMKSGIFKRRFNDFENRVNNDLQMIKDVQIQQLVDNQMFATVVYIAGQLAFKTNDTKRQLLAHAVVNTPSCKLSEDTVVILLNCIEKYSMRHLCLLRFLQNPKEYEPKDYYLSTSSMQRFYDYYSKREGELDRIIISDLHSDGMINTESLFVGESIDGSLEKKTTNLGDDMIAFFGIDKFPKLYNDAE